MTDNELQNLVEKISLDNFDRPFQHHATFNYHLRTTGGRYLLKTHDLEFNPKMATLEDFNKIIKHELVHYHLHLSHQGYQHKDSDFKQLLVRVGGMRYAPDIGGRRSSKYQWLYRCENGHNIIRKRRFQTERYRCGRCQAQIKFIGKLSNK
ncbi:MAG: SprT family protein [Leuconostoc suionicum]|uniref:SprT family protein n=1 Tax=Leuconostoc suionicum TaxID=1511761 RepID=UPI003F2C8016